MENHCIDVFFSYGQYPVHVLTAGSIIPDELNDILRNRTLQEETERNNDRANQVALSTNSNYIQSLLERHRTVVEESGHQGTSNDNDELCPIPTAEQISSHFRFYAGQGFYSYDCAEVKADGTAVYRLMAWPNQKHQLHLSLPQFKPEGFRESNEVPPLPEYFEM